MSASLFLSFSCTVLAAFHCSFVVAFSIVRVVTDLAAVVVGCSIRSMSHHNVMISYHCYASVAVVF